MTRLAFWRCVCAILLIPGLVSVVSAEDGFRPLFNGQDLSGWVLVNTPPQTWSITEEMLICSGKPIGEIRTDRMYQNFILEVEWRHMVPGGNAGIFVWADDITSKGVPFHRSVEVQVLENSYGQGDGHTTHGDIFPIHGAKMTPIHGRGGQRAFPTEERSKPSPEWNHYRIECLDGSISLAVNGKVVTRGTDASPRKGYLCIESEGGVVHYRNMRIKELPDTSIEAEHVAIANRGYRSLYSGIDLEGWTVSNDAGKSNWQVADWILRYHREDHSTEDVAIKHHEPLAERGFLFDIRPANDFHSLKIGNLVLAADVLTTGQWHRIEGSVVKGKLSVQIDGQVHEGAYAVEPGSSFQLAPNGPAEFANIYLRDLR